MGGKHMVDPSMVRVLGRSAFHDTGLEASGALSYLGGDVSPWEAPKPSSPARRLCCRTLLQNGPSAEWATDTYAYSQSATYDLNIHWFAGTILLAIHPTCLFW